MKQVEKLCEINSLYEMVKEEEIGPFNITRLSQIDVFKKGVDDGYPIKELHKL